MKVEKLNSILGIKKASEITFINVLKVLVFVLILVIISYLMFVYIPSEQALNMQPQL